MASAGVQTDRMAVAVAVVAEADAPRPGQRLASIVASELGARQVDLCCLFASAHFEKQIQEIALEIQEALGPRAFIGATGEAVICADAEYEHRPAITLWAAHMPRVKLTSFHLSQDDLPNVADPEALRETLGMTTEENPYFILLGDPFSFNLLAFLELLEEAFPGRPAVGGMASAGEEPLQNALVFGGHTLHVGMCGVALSGDVHIDTLVSQGCRPIGRRLVITKAAGHVIHELGGRTPMEVVPQVLQECTERDRELARQGGLLVGRVINESQAEFTRGDFLIRNVIHFDQQNGAMAIADHVRAGQTIQLHVRDRESASEDLATLLNVTPCEAAAGALIFTCNGRGTRLFTQHSHDARLVAQRRASLPAAGSFCAGEIGPIGSRNFLHGHTASIAFFGPAGRVGE